MRDESLNLEVRDFGPIGRAEVELRPLTLFVGPSNTGKSYLAMLIYALHRHFSRFDYANRWSAEEMVREALLTSGEQLARDVRNVRDGWREEDRKIQSHGQSVDVMRARIWKLSKAFKALIERILGMQGGVLCMEIERCFGSSIQQMTRNARGSKFEALIRRQPELTVGDYPGCVELKFSNATQSVSIPDEFEIELKGGGRRFADLEMEIERFNAQAKHQSEPAITNRIPGIFDLFEDIILPALLGSLSTPGHYLPAGRAALIDSFDAVVGSLINQASALSSAPPSVSGVRTDFLRQLVGLAGLKSEERESPPTEIEEKILKGSISINTGDTIKFPRFSYKPAKWTDRELSLKNASSMVSEVGPISLYEKHILKSGELLIVDEPESHLHPALQVKLFRQLVRLVGEGKRVLVTTHSEWVTEELANIVRRSKLEEQLPRVAEPKPGADNDVSLPQADVGVWRFSAVGKSGASSVEEIPLGETGLYDVGFDDVAISSHNEWARISNELGDVE